jgi:dolichol kinase
MVDNTDKILWGVVALVLIGLAIPWFLWRDANVAFGLPVWLWWHVGWMALAAVVFGLFANRAWGIGIEEGV